MGKATIVQVKALYGWSKCAEKFCRRRLNLPDCKVLLALLGRADVEHPAPVQPIKEAIQDFIDMVQRFIPGVKVILAGPLPHKEDPNSIA